MVQKLFWDAPYQTRLKTRLTQVLGAEVRVAETILYAFSGGQERDFGTIGGFPVLDARKEGLEIVYTLPAHHTLQSGQAVEMVLDWRRRYRLMRLHFAAEIILELVYQRLGQVEKIGAHIAEDKARIDFYLDHNIAQDFPMLLTEAHRLIEADLLIESSFSDPATQRRTWRIEGFGQVACGGTHLKHTGEVGRLQLKRKNVGKGKERIEIYLEDPAHP